MERIIGHLDMDAFFASVEERDKPYLKDHPVIVGANPEAGTGRGVVSTANYKARELGIHSALPIRRAWELCEGARPACVFVAPSFKRYSPASKEVFSIVRQYAPSIEQTSIDEAYIDLSHTGSFEHARTLAMRIKRDIAKHLKLTCSIGIAENKMIAKIASDFKKPNGLVVVTPEEVDSFLAPLPLQLVPGIGKQAAQRLHTRGLRTIADTQHLSWEELQSLFGKSGFSLWERVRGIDERPVVTEEVVRKSVGKHHTFESDTTSMEEVLAVARAQIRDISKTLTRKGFRTFRTVVVTVRFDDFTTRTRSITFDEPRSEARDIELKAVKLLLPFFERRENPNSRAIRLVGVRVEKLV